VCYTLRRRVVVLYTGAFPGVFAVHVVVVGFDVAAAPARAPRLWRAVCAMVKTVDRCSQVHELHGCILGDAVASVCLFEHVESFTVQGQARVQHQDACAGIRGVVLLDLDTYGGRCIIPVHAIGILGIGVRAGIRDERVPFLVNWLRVSHGAVSSAGGLPTKRCFLKFLPCYADLRRTVYVCFIFRNPVPNCHPPRFAVQFS